MIKKVEINYWKLKELVGTSQNYDEGFNWLSFKYDDEYLIKLEKSLFGKDKLMSEDDFSRYLAWRKEHYQSNQLFDCNIVLQQEALSKLQNKVKLTTFPQAIVFVGPAPFGLLVPKYENYQTMDKLKLSYDEMKSAFDAVIDANEELLENRIYASESAYPENVAIDRNSGDVKLVGLYGPNIKTSLMRSSGNENKVYEQMVVAYQLLNQQYVSNPMEFAKEMDNTNLYRITAKTFGESLNQIDVAVKKIGRR